MVQFSPLSLIGGGGGKINTRFEKASSAFWLQPYQFKCTFTKIPIKSNYLRTCVLNDWSQCFSQNPVVSKLTGYLHGGFLQCLVLEGKRHFNLECGLKNSQKINVEIARIYLLNIYSNLTQCSFRSHNCLPSSNVYCVLPYY